MTDPRILLSNFSRQIFVDGSKYELEIYRLEDHRDWTLEVIDNHCTSTVWHDEFVSDREAHDYVMSLVQKIGPNAFNDQSNILQFRRPLSAGK